MHFQQLEVQLPLVAFCGFLLLLLLASSPLQLIALALSALLPFVDALLQDAAATLQAIPFIG